MSELNNVAEANGTYNNIPTSVTSNTSVVNLIDGLTLTKNADKQNWIDGFLTYTLVLENTTNTRYLNPIITDVIDTNLVDFVNDSVTIDETNSNSYNYDPTTHTLSITLTEVGANSRSTITFRVKKKI